MYRQRGLGAPYNSGPPALWGPAHCRCATGRPIEFQL